MQKSFFSLPFATLILVACSSTPPAPVVSASGTGMMEPVSATGATENSYGWQTDVQQLPMPSTMTQPVYAAPQPTYQPIKATAAVSQDFTIPRDANNAPIYSQINKGFYNGESYTVRKGDTMFLIAYIAGKDVQEIARLNNMQEPYQLHIGQKINLGHSTTQIVSQPITASAGSTITYTQAPHGTAFGSDGTVTGPIKATANIASSTTSEVTYIPASNGTAVGSDGTVTGPVKAGIGVTPQVQVDTLPTTQPVVTSVVRWQWPTQGNVIAGFSHSDGGNKGIDIAGNKGQAVKAAATGKVVYAGNAIQGYGNLIIIKHNDDFLSAYAHNDSIKVKEQDNVIAGQTIATLGSSGTTSNRLHFEIRYHGKSVDPLRFLPKR